MKYYFYLFFAFSGCFLVSFCAVSNNQVKEKGNKYFINKKLNPLNSEIEENYISANQQKIDILHYGIDINLFPEKKNVEASTTITGIFKEKGVRVIDLNFYDNLKISNISLDGKSTEYHNTGYRLSVALPKDYSRDTFNLKITYSGKPKNLGLSSFVFGEINGKSLVYSLNEPNYASTWFPCNDDPSDKALLDIEITNDSSRTSVSNGKLIDVILKGDRKTFHWKSGYPISTYLICIFSSVYESFNDKYINEANDTLDICYYTLPEHRKNAEKDFEDHPKFLKVLSRLFGEYPFMKEKYGVAEFLWQLGAMENQTITGVGSNLINGKKFFNDVYIHELAHHWWGNAVSPACWKDVWLNEGFATYTEALYFEQVSGFDALKSTMNSKYKKYFKERLYDTEGDLFSQTIYNKGAWVLHMLRKEIGDSLFFNMLRAYFETYKYKNASTADLKAICEKVSGKDLTRFFNQWVYEGTGIIECDYNWSTTKAGTNYNVKLNINQVQKEFAEYGFPLQVKFIFEGDGKPVVKNVQIDTKNSNFEFEFTEKPVKIVFDPDNWLLAYFKNSAESEN